MKKPLKIVSIVLCLICLAVVLSGYLWLRLGWLKFASPEEMKHNAAFVNSIPALPANFLKVWDKIYPGSRSQGMDGDLFRDLVDGFGIRAFTEKDCKCDDIGYTAWDNPDFHFQFDLDKELGNYRRFGYGLQYYSSPEKCFDFWINHDMHWRGIYIKNLNELSRMKFNKDIEGLNDKEIIGLIAYRLLGRINPSEKDYNNEVENLIQKFKLE